MTRIQGLFGACLLLLCVLVTHAGAATVSDLYVTVVSVPDRSEPARRKGFVDALGQVAIRVSGSRDAPERLGTAAGDAQRYVQKFGYVEEGQLQVGFDPRSIDDLLTKAGLPIWGRERPLTMVSLQIEDANGMRRYINSATPGPERDAIVAAAALRGLPLQWTNEPTMSAASSGALESERQRLGADALLVGFGTRSASGLTVRWQLAFGEQTQDTAGPIESGIHLAADTYARMYAAASGALAELLVEVSGVPDLDAYARTLNYLEGLTIVRSVSVLEVNKDTLLLRVISRGDADTLRRALALDHRLAPEPLDQSAPDPQRLRLRLQPTR